MALLKDWAKGEYQFEIGIFKQVIDLGYHKTISKTETHDFTATSLITQMKKYFSEEVSYSMVALLFMVIRNYRIQRPNARPVQHTSPKAVPSNKKGTQKPIKEITHEMIKQVYTQAQLVYKDKIYINQAIEYLKNNGWNPASAQMYIAGIKNLFKGKRYGYDMSNDAITYFFAQILQDYGKDGLKRALQSLEARIDRKREFKDKDGNNLNPVGLQRIYNEWSRRL
jgi:hypothetical protein